MFAPKPRRQMLCFCSFRIFKYILYSSPKSPKIFSQYLPREKIWNPNSAIWVCLKIGYIPNEIAINSGIMISKTMGKMGFSLFSDTPIWEKSHPAFWNQCAIFSSTFTTLPTDSSTVPNPPSQGEEDNQVVQPTIISKKKQQWLKKHKLQYITSSMK